MRKIAILSLAALAGCAQPVVWMKPGATVEETKLQVYTCKMQAKAVNPALNPSLAGTIGTAMERNQDFQSCMDAHGFTAYSAPHT